MTRRDAFEIETMAVGEPVETELKFQVGPRGLGKLAAHPAFAAAAEDKRLRSVYFDTPQGALWAAGFSLRVREAGGAFVQTVKQAGAFAGFSRGEWECQTASGRPDLAALAQTPAAGRLGGDTAALRPVFTTTVRRATRLWREGAAVIELSLDVGQIRAGKTVWAIRELELELKAGTPDALFALARGLIEIAPLRLAFDSKAERGWRLARGDALEPVTAGAARISAGMSAAQAFRAVALGCLAQAAANAELLRRAHRPEALHQTRVGLRRLRAALTAFAPLLADPGLERLETETKWLAGELDGARDWDVFIAATFRPAIEGAADRPAFAALGNRLIELQSAAYARALAAIGSPRYRALLLEAARWIEVGDWSLMDDPSLAELRDEPIDRFAAGALDRLRKSVRQRGRGFEDLDARGRHKLRIKAKQLRYAAEFFAPALGAPKRRKKFLSRLEALQDALGELNDIAMARVKAPEAAGGDAQMAFAAGLAVGRRERRERAALARAGAAFEAFEAAKPFWRR